MFKNIMAYKIQNDQTRAVFMNPGLEMFAEEAEIQPPASMSWRTYGYTKQEKFGDQFVFDGALGARVLSVAMQERVLPGPVIRKAVEERAAEFKNRENRDPHRKELAQFKDEMVAKLLPQAFIRENHYLVMIVGDWVMIETGSSKIGEEICTFMRDSLTSTGLSLRPLQGQKAQEWLKEIAIADGVPSCDPDDEDDEDKPVPTANFYHMDSAVLKGAGVIRMKDVDFEASDAREALLSGKKVIELAIAWGKEPGVTNIKCAINDNLAIKRIKFSDFLLSQAKDEAGDESLVSHFDTSVAIAADLLKTFLEQIEKACYVSEDDQITELEQVAKDVALFSRALKFVPIAKIVALEEDEKDPLLIDAAEFVIEEQKPSISSIQRKLRVGYNRAATILDQLHNIGCVTSPAQMSGMRTVLWNPEDLENYKSNPQQLDDDDDL